MEKVWNFAGEFAVFANADFELQKHWSCGSSPAPKKQYVQLKPLFYQGGPRAAS